MAAVDAGRPSPPLSGATVCAFIMAAGSGERFMGLTEKQMEPLCGMPILLRSVMAFASLEEVGCLVVSAPEGRASEYRLAAEASCMGKGLTVVDGGATRQESVHKALERMSASLPDDAIAAIHDAVRPFADGPTIRRSLSDAATFGASCVCVPSKDTVKEAVGGFIARTVDRSAVWLAQTPQCFRFGLILGAHRAAAADGIKATDDAALAERMGVKVRVTPGTDSNIKITTRDDYGYAEYLLSSRKWE
ncbi:MAG: 2-C-methyl-D-erythritol 4-phosphate cytidylyltransferase [Oscillospiraceae bacterium]|nr:2-C-methyl-D-erythritol 4-phosphate cytidylyltransferase [Oscillospiraceae bacterium]